MLSASWRINSGIIQKSGSKGRIFRILQFHKLPRVSMKKLFFWIFSFLLTCNLTAQWEWQSPLPTGNYIFGVDFVDANHGWAFDKFGYLISTTNGGDSWKVTNDTIYRPMGDLDFINTNTGWIAGYKIRKTLDGGQSWVVQYVLHDTVLSSITFVNEVYGWAAGEDGIMLHTTDGGQNWQRQFSGTTENIRQVFFTDVNHGWAITYDPLLFATTDGGETWFQQLPGFAQCYFSSMYFIDNLNGWIVGNTWGDYGLILHSADGGNTWQAQDTTLYTLYSACFYDPLHGFIAGEDGKLFRTTNGGVDWTEQNLPVFRNIFSTCRAGGNLGWVSGEDGAIMHTADGGISWTEQSSGIKEDVYGSCFVDESNGWVAGMTGIHHTDDGGDEWELQYQGFFNDIFFTSLSHGWAAGPLGKIVNTTNGGIDWNIRNSGVTEYLECVFFSDGQHGWVCGRNGIILATTDGGLNWALQTTNTLKDLYSLQFVNSNEGWVVGDDGTVLHTTSGGEYWEPQAIPPPVWSSLNCVFFISGQVGWISGYHQVIHTEDGGENWVLLAEDISPSIRSIFFMDNSHGWAAGYTGGLIYTANGGSYWQAKNSGTNQDLTSIWFTDAENGWITGTDGTILHKHEWDPVWTPEYLQEKSEAEIRALPNPFSSYTTFEYTLENAGYASLEIFDNLGRKIFNLNEWQDQGKHSFTWVPDNLTTGIYFYRINVNEHIVGGKLIFFTEFNH
jgi:photosystem II stability/assembly factor-like uncharacterized protein